jgi:hypothetical protein
MADPIIVDDGGSTRLKRLIPNGNGAMNGLLNVNKNSHPPESSDSVPGPFSHIHVTTIDTTGRATDADYDLAANDSFAILSVNGQSAVGTIDGAGQLTITLQGQTNNAPQVEEIVFQNQLRYEVLNAGKIQQIIATQSGQSANFNVPGQSIYTAVVVS